jgi:type IV pilus assembly protein PilA
MKSQFKAKFLQNLVSKKKGNEGFTLIELLVVIIIVGVLAAIALPSFLNQIGKARGSEAKSNLGTINRAQQSYRLENQTFADDYPKLDAQIVPKFYAYDTTTTDKYTSKTIATPQAANNDLKSYAAGVAQSADNSTATLLCESEKTLASQTAAIDVTTAGSATVAASAGSCTNGVEVN